MRQEQVGKQINAGTLLLINEVELLVYRFLASGAKMPKNSSIGRIGGRSVH